MSTLRKLWLIGGTSESVILARAIAAQNLPYIITVTTSEAVNLYQDIGNLPIQVGKLDQRAIAKFCKHQKIIGIIDASHPFAQVISQTVIELAEQQTIPYLRYEREELSHAQIQYLDSFESLFEGHYLPNQRVLLTVGAKNLPLFQTWQSQTTLFARILPRLDSLQLALQAGFTPDRLLALRPPYSLDLELALWRQWQITLVVTKASGEAGGESIKQQAAQLLGIPLLAIARPKVNYPQQTRSVEEVLRFCQGCWQTEVDPTGESG